MHPKSKDRKGNAKLIADAKKDLRDAKVGPSGQRFRRSKYGEKLAALRARMLAAKDSEEE